MESDEYRINPIFNRTSPYQKTMAALLTLAAAASAAYMQPIVGSRGAVSRASPVNM